MMKMFLARNDGLCGLTVIQSLLVTKQNCLDILNILQKLDTQELAALG